MRMDDGVGLVGVDDRAEIGREELIGLLRDEELLGVESARVRNIGSPDVAVGAAEQPCAGVADIDENRLDDATAKDTRDPMVAREDPIGAVAFVSPKDLIAPVAGQKHPDSAFASEFGTEEGADC